MVSVSQTSAAVGLETHGVEYLTTIGLEVHAQVLTQSKMYCACSADVAYAPPNTHVCPVCMGMPGTLPVINLSVGLEVGAGLLLVMWEFLEQALVVRA